MKANKATSLLTFRGLLIRESKSFGPKFEGPEATLIGPDSYEGALAEPSVVEFDITGRWMKGWVMFEPEGVDEDEDLKKRIGRAVEFVETLPGK